MNYIDFIHNIVQIQKMYEQPHRKYHTWNHITSMFDKIKELKLQVTNEQFFAILFHDAVYVPGKSGENETKSALLAREFIIDNGIGNEICYNKVSLCIMSTVNHQSLCDEAIEIIDLDLMILAAEEDKYNEYAKNIREEYSFVNLITWKEKRTEFLNNMLLRKKIFLSVYFQELEQKARKNIRQEIDSLTL